MPRNGQKDRRAPTPQLLDAIETMRSFLDRRQSHRNAYAERCRQAREDAQRRRLSGCALASVNRARNRAQKEAAE